MRIGLIQVVEAMKRAILKAREDTPSFDRKRHRQLIKEFLTLQNEMVDLVNADFGEIVESKPKRRGRPRRGASNESEKRNRN